jgi:hypothetical protein
MARPEDILRARAKRATDAERSAADAEWARIVSAEEKVIARIQELVPRVLRALERDDYVWAALVSFEQKTLFGGFKRREVAGVPVCGYHGTMRGERIDITL